MIRNPGRISFLVDFGKRCMSDGGIGGYFGWRLRGRFFGHGSSGLGLSDFFCPSLFGGIGSILQGQFPNLPV